MWVEVLCWIDRVYIYMLFQSFCLCFYKSEVPYVDAVVAVTVMRVLLFVLHVCLMRECDGVRLTARLVWGMDEVC